MKPILRSSARVGGVVVWVWAALSIAGVWAEELPKRVSESPAPSVDWQAAYGQGISRDRVAGVQGKLTRDLLAVPRDGRWGWLPAVLRALDVPVESQLLVLSKTSSMRERVSPHTPRALYFNEDTFVAWIPGSPRIELASLDPELGVVFYSLEEDGKKRPRLTRDDRCLECHATARTFGYPGLLVRSFRPGEGGEVDVLDGVPMVSHRTPLKQRWGGWYVTSRQGPPFHLGNVFGNDVWERMDPERRGASNRVDLNGTLGVSQYPSPGSDVVALMVLDHLAMGQNLLVRAGYESRRALKESGSIKAANGALEEAAQYLLFSGEARMDGAVRGAPEFVKWFEGRGRRDKAGRTLNELDLSSRLLRYPCSPLVYGDVFKALPTEARKHVYRRMWELLTDPSGKLASDPATRQAIVEILRATEPDLPVYWSL